MLRKPLIFKKEKFQKAQKSVMLLRSWGDVNAAEKNNINMH